MLFLSNLRRSLISHSHLHCIILKALFLRDYFLSGQRKEVRDVGEIKIRPGTQE